MLCHQQVFHNGHLAEQADVLKRARKTRAVHQMRAAKHLIEQALTKLRRVEPVARLEFLAEHLNDMGGFISCIEQNVAAGGPVETGQAVKDGRFSRAVRPNECGNGAALHLKIDVV
ncbi:Uncharacterised protein [Enterobacter cloacae]|nr:Uncharacterised protein [Enterobacter cloacae]